MQHVQESDVPKVTPKELTIIKDAAAGMSCKQIAAKHGVSIQTVKNYRSSIFKKTGLANMVEVVFRFTQLGFIA